MRPRKSLGIFVVEILYKYLYNIFMIGLHHIFSSVAKIKILRTLCLQSLPMSLRTIASVSELPVFSAQRALQQLRDENWVARKRSQNRVLFLLNAAHDSYELVREIFNIEADLKLRRRASRYASQARSALDFADSARAFFKKKPWS